jgi:hypothetical protein
MSARIVIDGAIEMVNPLLKILLLKKFMKLFVVALVVALLSAAVLTATAAESAKRVDPNTLQPSSERVIFIKDAPAGGALTGDGSGFDADNPFIPSDHEQYDPTADHPQNHLKTAFYQATEMLGDDGGTIVICGPVHLGLDESYGAGDSTKDVFTYKWGTKKVIKFTSVYNGVDYKGGIWAISTAHLILGGTTTFENLTLELDNTWVVRCLFNKVTFGEGVNVVGVLDVEPAESRLVLTTCYSFIPACN